MKNFLLLLGLFAFSVQALPAQISISSATFPAAGDTLLTATDNLPDNINLGTTGGPQNWDFTSLQAPFTVSTVYLDAAGGMFSNEFPAASLYTKLVGDGEAYYKKTGTRVELLGYFGGDPIGIGIDLVARYNPPLVERHAPIQFIDQFNSDAALLLPFSADDVPGGFLDSLPIAPDSLRVRIAFQREELADAYGELTIPGNSFAVLRVKRTETRETRLDAKFAFGGWLDVTDLLPGNEFLGQMTEKSYHFLNDESKEPIAVVFVNPDNEAVQRVEYKVVEEAPSAASFVSAALPSVYAFPNPAIEEARFEFSHLTPGFYDLKIYNILGVVVWEKNYWIPGNRTEKVNLAKLRKGTYLYSLVDHRGKTISTKRLMIVRP